MYSYKLILINIFFIILGCGAFLNKDFYTDSVKNVNLIYKKLKIIALDWCDELLTYALLNSREDTKFVMMDCTTLDYEDNVFDTVVDTFGLQASHDYKNQFEEMKRVCKVIFYSLNKQGWR